MSIGQDLLTRFLLGQGEVRGQIVRLSSQWQAVVSRHTAQPGLHRMGELCAAAQLLAASLKFDGNLILQIHGDGPIRLMVVECRPAGLFRATLKTAPAGAGTDAQASFSSLVNRNGQGRFVVTLEPAKHSANQQPYQGIVPFEGDSVSSVLEHYMLRSEQVPSRLYLAADDQCAVGLLLQKMPDSGGSLGTARIDQDAWPRLQMLADTLTREELLSESPERLLHKLFWQENLQTLDERPVRFACTCSREKVAAMLKMLGREEVESILAEQGEVRTQCDYCNTGYRFDAVDAAAVFIEGVMPSPARPD